MRRTSNAEPRFGRAGRLAIGLLLAAGVTTRSEAHDFSLLAEPAVAEPGAPVALAMHVSEHFPGETVPWRSGHIVDFFVTDSKGRWEVEAPAIEGDPARARLALRAPGTAVVSLSTDPSYIEMTATAFEEYLRHEGHTAALDARLKAGVAETPGRERYTRHVKTILNATGPNASVALTCTGLTLEIVPETDLARIKPGDTLPVRVFYRGDPYPEAQVCATWDGRTEGAETYAWCGKTDGAGRTRAPIKAAGWQLIRTTRMTPLYQDPRADWHSYWSALTFKVEEPPR